MPLRVPAPSQTARNARANHLQLAVLLRQQQVQAIQASGKQSLGLAEFELARAADTVSAHHHAELALDLGGAALMPVGYVRPRRLASGADLSAGKLVFRDAAAVDG